MSSIRKQTPDILGNLMLSTPESTEQESNKAIKPASNKTIKQESTASVQQESNKTIKPANNKAIKLVSSKESKLVSNKAIHELAKEKATFNLSVSTLQALEDAWMSLRRTSTAEDKVTKTSIVETALTLALTELETKGKLSSLYKKLTQH
jgi:hypothetical protein